MSDWKAYYSDKKWSTLSKLMQDTVDCHINMGQDFSGMRHPVFGKDNPADRPYDDIDIAIRASEAGMKGIVFTSHVGPAFFRVPLIQKVVNEWAEDTGKRGVKVVGSVTLNYAMGGLNPEVVRMMARFGGKVLCMPTTDGWHDLSIRGIAGGIELVKNGKIVPELEEIIGITADNDMVMDISHVNALQRFTILDDAKAAGVKGFYVFNPMPKGNIGATDEQWVELAKKGLKLMPAGNTITNPERFNETWNLMMKVGVDSLVSGTDLNNWHEAIHPVDGLRSFMIYVLNKGMSESDIEKMFKANPAKLLDL